MRPLATGGSYFLLIFRTFTGGGSLSGSDIFASHRSNRYTVKISTPIARNTIPANPQTSFAVFLNSFPVRIWQGFDYQTSGGY